MFVEEAIKVCYQGETAEGLLYKLPKDFPAFEGHFKGHPLLPAICHISFCNDAANRLFKKEMEVKGVKKAKFINPVLPEMLMETKLSKRPDGWYFAELIESVHHKKLSQLILQFSERNL